MTKITPEIDSAFRSAHKRSVEKVTPEMTGGSFLGSGFPLPEQPGEYDGQTANMDPNDPEKVTHKWQFGQWWEEGQC